MRRLRIWLAERLLLLSGRVFHERCQCLECAPVPGAEPWCGNIVRVDDRWYDPPIFVCAYCTNDHRYG